jgi:hypothetical protein
MTNKRGTLIQNKGQKCSASWPSGNCDREAFSKGLCGAHYSQKSLGKEFTPISNTHFRPGIQDPVKLCHWYFQNRIKINGTCWLWTGKASREYPHIQFKGEQYRLYRFVAQWINNAGVEFLLGTVVHHTCSNRRCINPEHLQIIDAASNTAEMLERRAYQKRIAELEAKLFNCTCSESNMGKVWDDGTVHYNDFGKIIKPPTYSPPDIESILYG